MRKAGGNCSPCAGRRATSKYANSSYMAAHAPHESEVYYQDARIIDPNGMPDFDLLCAGFPCQSFSVAGKRQGFADTRGALFFEIARILRCKKPAYLLLENVPGLLSHDQGKTFSVILDTLCELGYCVEWAVDPPGEQGPNPGFPFIGFGGARKIVPKGQGTAPWGVRIIRKKPCGLGVPCMAPRPRLRRKGAMETSNTWRKPRFNKLRHGAAAWCISKKLRLAHGASREMLSFVWGNASKPFGPSPRAPRINRPG